MIEGQRYSVEDGAMGIGDPRLAADVRVLGTYGAPFTLAAGLTLHAPVGSRDDFASDGKLRLTPRVQAAGRVGIFVYAGSAAFNLRTQNENIGSVPFGSEVQLGGSAGVLLLDERLLLGPEIWASTVVSDDLDGFLERESTPFEAIVGAHYEVTPDWRAGLGIGPGLSRGLGTPQARVLASIEWAPDVAPAAPAPPPDTDGDGVLDTTDACPDQAGPTSTDPASNGCPPPPDSDGDGTVDEVDACPTERGPASSDPARNGCPVPVDSDDDGIPDEGDACPNDAGPESSEPTKRGCPVPPDADGDGFPDAEDACPQEPGVKSADPARDGCPQLVINQGEIRLFERIEFDKGTATLRAESDPILQALLKTLTEHPELEAVEVQGHTDDQGAAWFNRRLSQQRAEAVVQWLVERGIAPERLHARGYGAENPVDSNDTDEGRQNNRRVQFVIENQSDESADAGTPTIETE